MLEIPRDSTETPTIWWLINSYGLFWEGRIDANYTTQNMWINDNKYTSDKNSLLLKITSNLMKIFQKMAEEWRFKLNMTWWVPDWGVKNNLPSVLMLSKF